MAYKTKNTGDGTMKQDYVKVYGAYFVVTMNKGVIEVTQFTNQAALKNYLGMLVDMYAQEKRNAPILYHTSTDTIRFIPGRTNAIKLMR